MTPESSVNTRLKAPPAEMVAARLAAIRRRIEEAGRDPATVRIVAVTKGFDESAPRAAAEVGLTDIGENYSDELIYKHSLVGAPELIWNMIGAIQRRKIKSLAPVVNCWQTVSRREEIESLSAQTENATFFIQVDTTGSEGRNGAGLTEVEGLVSFARQSGLEVRGLMTIGPNSDPALARAGFERVAVLGRDLGLNELSMGMTDDLEVAVGAGSTMLRVGRALFGARSNGGRVGKAKAG
jgi:uncharacterized pyridoxal phosphate-containing UPF0001 family protein